MIDSKVNEASESAIVPIKRFVFIRVRLGEFLSQSALAERLINISFVNEKMDNETPPAVRKERLAFRTVALVSEKDKGLFLFALNLTLLVKEILERKQNLI